MDELLSKDTIIDQQAVLNKNLQKRIDSNTDQASTLSSQYQHALSQFTSLEQENATLLKDNSIKDTQIRNLESELGLKSLTIKQLEEEIATSAQANKLET